MIWTKYIIKTTTKDADLVSAILFDHGISDIQIEDNIALTDEELNEMYADLSYDPPEDDGRCTIDFYIEYDENGTNRLKTEEELERLRAELEQATELFGIDPVSFESLEVDPCDWENNWKAYFKPFTVCDILIRPTWEEAAGGLSGKTEIVIDPGMAFGTGAHETTRLCLKAISEYLKAGDEFHDLGCGSGILGIAAAKLGAKSVAEVDIDAKAVQTAKENFEINKTDEKAVFLTGDLVKNEELKERLSRAKADLICANILAQVLEMMMPDFQRYLKEGGVLVMSGILNEKEDMIKDAVSKNEDLEYIKTDYDGDWCAVYVKRR